MSDHDSLVRVVGEAATEYMTYVNGVDPAVPDTSEGKPADAVRLRTPEEAAELWATFYAQAFDRVIVWENEE